MIRYSIFLYLIYLCGCVMVMLAIAWDLSKFEYILGALGVTAITVTSIIRGETYRD